MKQPFSRLLAPVTLLYFIASTAAAADGSVDVSIPLTAPSSAPQIAPDLLSFSIEQDRWVEWAGNTSKNTFFYNALNNLKQITGASPWVRIGADSEDHTNFDPSLEYSSAIFPATTANVPYPEASNITVGDGFYKIVSHLPSDTKVIFGLNLIGDNLTDVYLETKSIIKAFSDPAVTGNGIKLAYLEIGNEADLYAKHGWRPTGWNITQYVADWVKLATNVTAAAGLSSTSSTKLIGAAFAESSHSSAASGFSPQSIFEAGILQSKPGSLISTISQHHYSGSFCSGSGGLLQNLMTKSTIRSNLTAFSPDIAATKAQGLEYILGETNSYSCHGAPGVSNTAGAALWALDYTLFASQIGISRLHFHEGIGYKYNLIQPVTLTRSILDGSPLSQPLAPHVQPAYYAAIIAAEAIGHTGSAHAVELSINNARIAGYAFYEGGVLVRAVLINSQAYLATGTSGSRGTTHVNISLGNSTGTVPTTMSIKRLTIGHADDTSGVTWGGQSYETSDALVSGKETTETRSVSAGVDVSDTEVVLLNFASDHLQAHGRRAHLRKKASHHI